VTRSAHTLRKGKGYRHEMTDDDHRALAEVLRSVEGMVVLSGYACELYDRDLYPDWDRREKATHGDGAVKRTEVLWLNPACRSALAQEGAA
jgi:DNA adenine methylase